MKRKGYATLEDINKALSADGEIRRDGILNKAYLCFPDSYQDISKRVFREFLTDPPVGLTREVTKDGQNHISWVYYRLPKLIDHFLK